MGGVDLLDALLKYYSIRQKMIKWYKALLLHFIDVAVVNGLLLHKELAAQKKCRPLTHKRFQELLVEQLVDFQPGRASAAAAPVSSPGPAPSVSPATCVSPSPSRSAAPDAASGVLPAADSGASGPAAGALGLAGGFGCFPVPICDPSTVCKSQKATASKRRCVHCTAKSEHNLTPWKCSQCDVPLCLILDRNCFQAGHLDRACVG